MGRDSASRAESKDLDSAIFAQQKSHKMCSAQVHTAPRPLRGVQSLGQGGATASATIALEADTARLSPCLPKKTQRVASVSHSKNAALYLFRGFESAGRG